VRDLYGAEIRKVLLIPKIRSRHSCGGGPGRAAVRARSGVGRSPGAAERRFGRGRAVVRALAPPDGSDHGGAKPAFCLVLETLSLRLTGLYVSTDTYLYALTGGTPFVSFLHIFF